MDQTFFTSRKYYGKRDLFPKNQCKITIFTYVHSDWWWVDAGKMMKKLSFYPDYQEGKNICLHRKSKIQKYKNIAALQNRYRTDVCFWKYKI